MTELNGVTMTDEELVRATWEWVQVRLAEPYEGVAQGKWVARLPLLPFSQVGFDTEAEAWAAAAEFTRERLEEVRQREREIDLVSSLVFKVSDYPCTFMSFDDEAPEPTLDMILTGTAMSAREDVTARRVIARLEAALADLRRGMK